MCDLSVGIFERGYYAGMKVGMELGRKAAWEEGLKEGIAKGSEIAARLIVTRLLQAQMPLSFILYVTERTEDFVRQVAEKEGLVVKE